jgi:hypothetical protein
MPGLYKSDREKWVFLQYGKAKKYYFGALVSTLVSKIPPDIKE